MVGLQAAEAARGSGSPPDRGQRAAPSPMVLAMERESSVWSCCDLLLDVGRPSPGRGGPRP